MTVDIHPPERGQKTPAAVRRSAALPSYFRPLKKDMRTAAIIAALLLALFVVGVPQFAKPKIDMMQPVIIDLVDLKDVKIGPVTTAPNTTQKIAPPKPVIRKEAPVEPPKPVKADVKPPEPPPEKSPEKSVEPAPPPEDAISLKPKKDPPPEKPKAEPPKKPKVEKTEKTPDPKQQADFSNMLKNLVGEDTPAPPPVETPAADNKPVDTTKRTAIAAAYGETLTLSEMDALRQQLAGCWNVPTGAMDAENLIVDIQVIVRPDRTVQSATVVDQGRYGSDSFFRAAADSARRAVLNPQCSPLLLPPDQYDTWKNMVVRFNPREMFGGL